MIDKIAPMAASATSVCFRRSDNSAINASHGIAWAAVPPFQATGKQGLHQG